MNGTESGFIARIYRASLLLYVVVSLYVQAYLGPAAWWGLTAGTGLSLLSLLSVEQSVKRFLERALQAQQRSACQAVGPAPSPCRGGRGERSKPGILPPRRFFWAVLIGKYAVFAVIVGAVVGAARSGQLNLFAFIGGYALVHAVIVLKALEANAAAARASRRTPPHTGAGG